MINTTISGNGDSTSRVGAIFAEGTVHVAWSTIANNTASYSGAGGAGGIVTSGGSVTLAADVLAGNGVNCLIPPTMAEPWPPMVTRWPMTRAAG